MLLGRGRELDALAARIVLGRSAAVVGEAGIGKTELLREAARRERARVFEGGALATLTWVPFLPLARALGRQPSGADPLARAESVVSVVEDGVLVLDDLQWADVDTLSMLPLLAGRIVLLCAVRRGDPGSEPALKWLGEAGVDAIDLSPLNAAEARQLVRTANPTLEDPDVERVFGRARGNPFLLIELARQPRSPTLKAALAALLQRQAPLVRQTAARLALLGRPAPAALLGGEADLLIEAGLAVREGDRLALRHALIGEAAVAGLSRAQRRALHRELARLVDDAGEAARHHAEAGERRLARLRALEAAEQARTPGERARHLAVAAGSADESDRIALSLSAADALVSAGLFDEAEHLLETLEADTPLGTAEVHLHRARARFGRSDIAGAARELRAGRTLATGSATPVELRLLLEEAEHAAWNWDAAAATSLAREAWELAQRIGAELARAGTALAKASFLGLALAEAATAARRARRTARASGEPAVELEAAKVLAMALETKGDFGGAIRVARAAQRRARSLELRSGELEWRVLELHLRFAGEGPGDEVVAGLRELLGEPVGGFREAVVADLAAALADRGEPHAARRLIHESLPAGHQWGEILLYALLADVEWLDGRPAFALAAARRARAPGIDDWITAVEGWALADLGRSAEITDPRPRYARYAGAAETRAALRALHDPARLHEAEALFREAEAAWRERRQAQRCAWGAAEAARRVGDSARAREQLLELERALVGDSAQQLLGRVRRSLRGVGVRTDGRPRARGPLSTREREVLALAGDGRTSREIAARLGLSPRTVDAQVRSAMQKLGARTRSEAMAVAVRDGILPEAVTRR